MNRDILFLVQNLPSKCYVSGVNAFMAQSGQDFIQAFSKVSQNIPELRTFLFLEQPDGLAIAGFRNEFADETEAVHEAWQRLESILDGVCFLTEEHGAKVCRVCMIREANSPSASLKGYLAQGWARLGNSSGLTAGPWFEREAHLSNYALGFINLVAAIEETNQTDLSRQLAYSMKFLRKGITSGSIGIQYLCKFSGLEGLVCGAIKYSKSAVLEKRLGVLFRQVSPQIGPDLRRLWNQRCEASHQARAFDLKLHADLPLLDKLMFGTFVFAMDHLQVAKTIDELWEKVDTYSLPSFALLEPPEGLLHFGFTDGFVDYGVKITNIGPFCDRAFAESAQKVRPSPPVET